MFRIFTRFPLSVDKTSLCLKQLQPSNSMMLHTCCFCSRLDSTRTRAREGQATKREGGNTALHTMTTRGRQIFKVPLWCKSSV